MQKILFIDRDGTLIEEPADFQVDALDKIRLCPKVIPALLALQQANYRLVMVSNQDGLGRESFPETDFQQVQDFLLSLFSSQGINFAEIYICPHRQEDNCDCRKPKVGLLNTFFQNTSVERSQCWMIGDRESDKLFAENLGVAFVAINANQDWQKVVEIILNRKRQAILARKTNETDIHLTLCLDSEAPSEIITPIGFFSHMLAQIANHAGISLQLEAKGDVEVDEHHLIEDTAIALGQALRQALNDKWGIGRYGFTLPMDEALASVAIDLCGRSFCAFDGCFTREFVGGLATEMVPHFFNSFAHALGASLHIKVKGENHHHMIEACFKALGRALRQAITQTGQTLPSTKGTL